MKQGVAKSLTRSGHEREAKLDARPCSVKSRSIMQLGKRERNNNELHFSAERTWARASAIGIT